MQFRIEIVANPGSAGAGWQVRVLDDKRQPLGGPLAAPRDLRLCGTRPLAFPLPPADEAAALPAAAPHHALCNAPDETPLIEAYSNIVARQPAEGGVVAFGRYLFDTLLGQARWAELDRLAGEEPVELALCWEAGDAVMNRLPWEMMHDGQNFLAALPQVALTRRVRGTAATLAEIDSAPRVLFGVGSALDDAAISAGAEYMGLLRRLRHGDLSLKTYLLPQASTATLADAIAWFEPTVVHLVSHGAAPGGKGHLILVDPTNKDKTVEVYADNLLGALTANGTRPPPQIVVLNACYTATTELWEAGEVAFPLAVELVRGGVPVVVGMAGEVADQACRLFTRRLYEALLQGADVAQAVAEGRRAGITQGTDPRTTVDWAFPVLYLSDAVARPRLSVAVQLQEAAWQRVANEYATPAFPAFCDRHDLLKWHDLLLTADPRVQRAAAHRETDLQVLAIHTEGRDTPDVEGPRFGRTWLLREYAAKAVRDGHVPVLVSRDVLGGSTIDWPRDLESLIELILQAAGQTAAHFAVEPPGACLSEVLWGDLQAGDPLPACIRGEFVPPKKTANNAPHLAAAALRADLLAFLERVRALRPARDRAHTRLLLLIDDVHQMEAAASVLLHSLIGGPYGLQRARREVAVVLTFALQPLPGQDTAVQVIKDWLGGTQWAESQPMGQFSAAQEHNAYQTFLLYWRDQRAGRPRPLSVSRSPDKQIQKMVERLFDSLSDAVQGVPSYLEDKGSTEIRSFLKVLDGLPLNPLQEADDEDALSQVRLNQREA